MPILDAVRFSEGRKEAFRDWAHAQLVNTQGNRGALERAWRDHIEQWRAKLPTGEKEFPWPGASNLVFPLTAMHTDPVYADLMQTLHAPADYFTVTASRPDRVEHAAPMTEFLTHVDRDFLRMRHVNGRVFMDAVVLGTGIYKAHWLHERKQVRDYARDDGGARRVETRVKIRSQPLVEHVPLHHFWIPAEAWAIDPDAPVGGAQWVAQELYWTRSQLAMRAKAESPHLPAFNKDATAKVLAFEMAKNNPTDDAIQAQAEFRAWHDPKIRLFEMWARFDVNNDGIDEDVVALLHLESGEILRVLHTPALHGQRPFHRVRYLPTFGFYGQGVAEIDEWAQLTGTKLLNAQMDNVMLANTRMFSAPYGYMGGGDTIYPGKVWYVGPGEQIGEVRLGDAYPSIFQMQNMVMQWSEQRTGMSEVRQGDVSQLPSRTPAHTVNAMLQESSKRFDMILAEIREEHNTMGLRLVQLLAQWYQEDPFHWQRYCTATLGEEDAKQVMEVLATGVHELPEQLGVNVSATSQLHNKEKEKQDYLGLSQVLTQTYGSLLQSAQIVEQTQPGSPTHTTALQAMNAGIEILTRIVEKFDIQNPDAFVQQLRELVKQQSGPQQQPPGGPGVVPIAPGAPAVTPPFVDPQHAYF